MNIVFDTREPQLYSRCAELQIPNTSVQMLSIGDIVIRDDDGNDIVLIERKSLNDLLASIKDGRYEEQSHRLLNASGVHPHHILYVIEGMFSQLSKADDKSIVISAMTSLQLYKGFGVVRTSCVNETADFIIGMANKIKRNKTHGKPFYVSATTTPSEYSAFVKKVKKENITAENIGIIMLSQIPGISTTIASELLKVADGDIQVLIQIIRENPQRLSAIELKSGEKKRKLGKKVVEHLCLFLGKREV